MDPSAAAIASRRIVFPPVGLVLVLMISAIIGPPIRLILMDSAGCLPVGRFRGKADLRGRVASTASVAPGAGLFHWGGDRRVKASGDELVSLGFRVGNPSAIGWHQQRIFQHPCDTEQRSATHSLRRKMARSQAERDPAYHRTERNPITGIGGCCALAASGSAAAAP